MTVIAWKFEYSGRPARSTVTRLFPRSQGPTVSVYAISVAWVGVAAVMILRRIAWALPIAIILIAIAALLLLFADSYAVLKAGESCAQHFPNWRFLAAWVGCSMAAHENLAGGLVGGAGALFAAWLAFTAVQEQLADERRRRRQQELDAKEAALVCITQPVHAAATALLQINDASQAAEPLQATADRLVELAVMHVTAALESFTVRESARDLAVHDKVMYLLIVSTLSTFVNVSTNPSPILSRGDRLRNQRHALMRLHQYLGPFDTQLAQVYAQDSGTAPPAPSMAQHSGPQSAQLSF